MDASSLFSVKGKTVLVTGPPSPSPAPLHHSDTLQAAPKASAA